VQSVAFTDFEEFKACRFYLLKGVADKETEGGEMNKYYIYLLFFAVICNGSTILDQGLGLDGMQMGGAYTANPLSCSALYWNPANLTNLKHTEIYTSVSKYFGEVSNSTFIFSSQIQENVTFGLGYLGIAVGDISYTDNSGLSLGENINYKNEVYLLGLGYRLNNSNSLGVSYKLFRQTALAKKANESIDFAYRLSISETIQLGVVAENLLSSGAENEVYAKYRAGIEQAIGNLRLAMDVVQDTQYNKSYVNYGFAFVALAPLEIRGGMNSYLDNYFLGASFVLEGIRIEYMFCNPELGTVHRVGFGLNI